MADNEKYQRFLDQYYKNLERNKNPISEPQSDWISWKQLSHLWKMEDFEIVECLRGGLQPYSKYGQPVPCLYDPSYKDNTPDAWRRFNWPRENQKIEWILSELKNTYGARFKKTDVNEYAKSHGLSQVERITVGESGLSAKEKVIKDAMDMIVPWAASQPQPVTAREVRAKLEEELEWKDFLLLTPADIQEIRDAIPERYKQGRGRRRKPLTDPTANYESGPFSHNEPD